MEDQVPEVSAHVESFTVSTPGRSFTDITDEVVARVAQSGVTDGLCNVFLRHTSASIILCENADPSVRRDLEVFMSELVPDGDSRYEHTAEGPDDMPAHVRSVLTANSITVPVENGRLALGTWQGLYLWEHRHREHSRRVTVTILG